MMDQDKLLAVLGKSPWVKRRIIYRSLLAKEYPLANEQEFKSAFDFLFSSKQHLEASISS